MNPHQIMLEEEKFVDLKQESCTVDEAVAKMLGWLRSPIHNKIIKVTPYGEIPPAYLPTMRHLPMPLDELLTQQREMARSEFLDACGKYISYEAIERKEKELIGFDETIRKADIYLRAIKEELKNKTSMLVIDQEATDETGELHITLESLDQFAREKFGIALLDSLEPTSSTENNPSTAQLPIPPDTQTIRDSHQDNKKLSRMQQQEHAVLEIIKELGHNPKCLPVNTPGKAGVKAEVRKRLDGHPLFKGSTIFEKTWERLRSRKELVYADEASSPQKNTMGDTCGGG